MILPSVCLTIEDERILRKQSDATATGVMCVLNIVLVEPEIPQNTGNIARTCAATGCVLHLVEPLGFQLDDRRMKRAGLDYWHYLDITYYENTQEFLEKHSDDSLFFFTTKGRKVYSEQSYPDDCYLIFGREDAGIDEHILLRHPDSCLRLPMIGPVRSLNLSNSVAVGVYEVLRQWDFPELLDHGHLRDYEWK